MSVDVVTETIVDRPVASVAAQSTLRRTGT